MKSVSPVYIKYSTIFNHLEINKGDIVYIASNIIKIIHAARKTEEFDINKFIDSIQHKVGNEGTLLFPAFNFELKQQDKFDIKNTAPVTGLLPLAAFKRIDFKRTQHPLHSFMVWGKYADELAGLTNKSSFGEDSPFAFIHNKKAKLLAIDLDFQHSYPFAHYVEEQEQVPYRAWKKYNIDYIDESGNVTQRAYNMFAKKRGYVNNVNPLYEILKQQGAVKIQMINNVEYKITEVEKAFEVCQKDIQGNKARNICYFDPIVYFKSLIKSFLGK